MSLWNSISVALSDSAMTWSKPKWDPATELPRLAAAAADNKDDSPRGGGGKVAVLTGGSSECGFEVLKGLVEVCERVYVLGRSQARNEKAIESLGAQAKERAVSITCDLDSLASVRLASDAFYVQEQRRRGVTKEQVLVDVVIANAGVFTKDTKERSQDGFEKMWATNSLAHHALIHHLQPAIRVAAERALSKGSKIDAPRVIITSSGAHACVYDAQSHFMPLDEKLRGDGGKAAFSLYGRSKMGNILDQRGWVQHFKSAASQGDAMSSVVVVSVHPGGIRSDLGRDYSSSSTFAKYAKILLDHLALWPSPYGAINMLYAALIDDADALAAMDGKYIQPWCSVLEPATLASDGQLAKQVWQHMEDTVEEERIAAGVQTVG